MKIKGLSGRILTSKYSLDSIFIKGDMPLQDEYIFAIKEIWITKLRQIEKDSKGWLR